MSQNVSICLVLDVSGSMDLPATKVDSYEPTFTRLDLVKHSVKTIYNMLRDNDILTLITFSDKPSIVINKLCLTKDNRVLVQNAIDSIRSLATTNIPSAMNLALSEHYDHIVLLTDGENNGTIPPRHNLSSYVCEMAKEFTGKIHTIGLGMSSELDTYSLQKISSFKNGLFCFCPDASMIGTVFIHLVANMCINQPGPKFEEYDKFLNLLTDIYNTKDVNLLSFVFNNEILNEELSSPDPNKGQIEKALQNWDKWGRHYLTAFIDSHRYRFTTNFKDQSLQGYATPDTLEFIKNGEKIFATIEAPIPSYNNYHKTRVSQTCFTSLTCDKYGGCFGEDTELRLLMDSIHMWIKIKDLKKGMCIASDEGLRIVECVIESPPMDMINVSGVWITKKHPICIKNSKEWKHAEEFEHDPNNVQQKRCFNVVLKYGSSISISKDHSAVIYGHNLKGSVVEHDYLGTDKILNDLKKSSDYENGHVFIKNFMRNEKGYICAIEV